MQPTIIPAQMARMDLTSRERNSIKCSCSVIMSASGFARFGGRWKTRRGLVMRGARRLIRATSVPQSPPGLPRRGNALILVLFDVARGLTDARDLLGILVGDLQP